MPTTWTDEVQPFGANHVPLLTGLSSSDGQTPIPVAVDPLTGAVLTEGGSGGGGSSYQYQNGASITGSYGNSLLYSNGTTFVQVSSSNPLPITGTISVGSTTDESTFTAGTSTTGPIAGVFNDSLAAITSGQQGTARMTAYRGLHTNLRNASGTEIATSSNPVRTDPTGTTTQPVSLTSTTITGTVAVTESGTWNVGSSSAVGSSVPSNAFYVGMLGSTGVLSGLESVAAATANNASTPNVLASAAYGIFNTTLPTVSSGGLTVVQLDSSGRQIMGTSSATIGTINIAASQTLATVTTVGAVTAITNALPAGTNALGTVGTTPAVINVGQQTSGTTAVQLSTTSTVPTNGIIVEALAGNAAPVYIGGTGVTTSTGFQLSAGQSVSFTCNLNTLYVVGANTSDKICWNVE